VKAGEMSIEVLGTHFNTNAYADEEAVKTTLLEGKVRATANGQAVILVPGQQAKLSATGNQLSTLNNIDVEEIIAWKNGLFFFNSTEIKAVMRQISRWYDVNVSYENQIDGKISGNLPRSGSIGQVLKILEATGKVEFTVKGKEISVKTK